MREFIIHRQDAGQRFDKYLKRILPEASTGFLYKMIRKKNITLNGKKSEGKELLKEKDSIQVFFSDETFLKFAGHNDHPKMDCTPFYLAYETLKELSVVFQNEDVLILNKPAGILTQKATDKDFSANEWLIGYLLKQHIISETSLNMFKPSVCNRLDRNTSGLVLCGVSLPGTRMLGVLLKSRDLQKYYVTYVQGLFENQVHGKGYLVKHEASNKVSVYQKTEDIPAEEKRQAERIETIMKPLAMDREKKVTKLEIHLVTGKSHQIRAHLAALGYPIIGDKKYGYRNNTFDMVSSYQMLHAYKVVFPDKMEECDALSGKKIYAPIPDTFKKLEEMLCLHGVPED